MDWNLSSGDEVERGLDHFGGLTAASQAEVCELIQAADRAQLWMVDGARSLAEWVAVRLRIRIETARLLVSVARRLSDLPVISARFAAGELSLDQVDALTRIATPTTEEGLVEETLGLSNAVLDRLARRAHPPTLEEANTADRLRGLWIQHRLDESGGRLTAELANTDLEIVETRLRSQADRYPPNPETGVFDPYPQRMADALVEVCATTGDSSTPAQVTVYADLQALTTETEGVTELASGSLVPNEMARRLSCDCVLETVITDGSVVIGVGRNSRTIPAWLRRLVHHRDAGQCRFPGCANTGWLEVHHVIHWSQGGSTDLDNLILLCGFHHRFLHDKGWHITHSDDGRFVFRKPDWTIYPRPQEPLHPRLKALVGAGRHT